MSGFDTAVHESWTLEDCLRYAQSNLGVGGEEMSARDVRERWNARQAISAALKRNDLLTDEVDRLHAALTAADALAARWVEVDDRASDFGRANELVRYQEARAAAVSGSKPA